MMKTQLTIAGLLAATALAVIIHPAASTTNGRTTIPPITPPITTPLVAERPRVEVVFALDTTGSMGGLLQGAKDKIWSIATTLAQGQPAPEIRMGLVAYRDRGDAYVTRVFDLSDNLDTLYAQLMDLEAGGGGDGPESVNQALYDSVHKMSWSQDPDSYKVVFLVGDAPAHMDYQEVQYPAIVADAEKLGIRINTIQCGDQANAARMWQQIAQLGQGDYHQVSQSGGVIAIATPYDDEIARLASALDDTRLYFGDKEQRAAHQAKTAASAKLNRDAPADVLARRAEFNATSAGAANLYGADELVDAVATGRVDLDEVEEEALPEPLRELSAAERKDYVGQTAAKREQLRQQIDALTGKRRAHVARERAALPAAPASFEERVAETVATQASEKGLTYDRSPQP